MKNFKHFQLKERQKIEEFQTILNQTIPTQRKTKMSVELSIDDDNVTDYLLDLDLRIPKKEFFPNIIEDSEHQQQQHQEQKDQQQQPENVFLSHQQQHLQPLKQDRSDQHPEQQLVDMVMKMDDFVTKGSIL